MADDAERARHIVQDLGHVLAKRTQSAAAGETGAGAVAGSSVFDDVAR